MTREHFSYASAAYFAVFQVGSSELQPVGCGDLTVFIAKSGRKGVVPA